VVEELTQASAFRPGTVSSARLLTLAPRSCPVRPSVSGFIQREVEEICHADDRKDSA
jgi:hypothetical protein